jgi:hypothetical protein
MKNCPFCNKEMIMPVSYYAYKYCDNHKCAQVEVDERGMFIIIKPYHIMIKDNEMLLFKDLYTKIATLPVDKSLTPENFEDKLKFYTMFK